MFGQSARVMEVRLPSNMEKKAYIIVGPTASGKSAYAVQLAKKVGGEVISADSRQVYRGMDIGTGKVTKKEMAGIPHYLLSVADPRRRYSVARYQRDAARTLQSILVRGKTPIICGGTGLYIDALVEGALLPSVPPNPALRKKLERINTEQLFTLLKKKDPRRAQMIDAKNPRRLIRALEITEVLGKVPRMQKRALEGIKFEWIGIDLPDEKLKKKIHLRLLSRMRGGMLAEVKRLRTRGLSWKRMESFGLEYRWLARYLQNKITKEEMLEKLEMDIWHYAKRQRTWFKRNKKIKWV